MIEFVNYPPEKPDDVKLSSVGKRALRKLISDSAHYQRVAMTTESQQDRKRELSTSLYERGQAIGYVLVSSLPEPNKKLAEELAATIKKDYEENVVTNPGSHNNFPSGIHLGIRDAIELRVREQEAIV